MAIGKKWNLNMRQAYRSGLGRKPQDNNQESLSVADAVERVSPMADGAFALCQMERSG
jgi:hypothetical protein